MTNRPRPQAMTRIYARDALAKIAALQSVDTATAAALLAECALDVIAAGPEGDEGAAAEGYRLADDLVGRRRDAVG